MVINPKIIIELINNPTQIDNSNITALESLLLEYPYFSSGQLLLTKGLLNINSIRYNQQLKKAAAFSIDRKKLFKLITYKKKAIFDKENEVESETKNTKELKIGKPLDFNENEYHSFSEWLNLTNIKEIKRKEDKNDLIDKFLDINIKNRRPKKELFFKATDIAKESLTENKELITPTLAKVYLEQGYYEKAITAYKKLILKYPKKSSLFANQIKLINKLNK